MGLSSSQARLLNLTARMHDIEYKAQNLEAQKLQMANESTQVYKEYEDALNKQKVQFKKIGSDGSATYEDVTGKSLREAGYAFEVVTGEHRGEVYSSVYKAALAANVNLSDSALGGSPFTLTQERTALPFPKRSCTSVEDPDTLSKLGDGTWYKFYFYGDFYITEEMYNSHSDSDPIKPYRLTVSSNYTDGTSATISNLLQNGFIILVKLNGADFIDGQNINAIKEYNETLDIYESNIAIDTSLQEVSDETELKKAEAKYEADMRKINAKDKKFDTDLAAMDQERNAIKTEMDTLKSVAKDNVDRTFKLFS